MSARSMRRNHDRAARAAERRLSRRAKLAAGVTIVGASAALAPAAQAANFTVDTLDDPGNGDTCAATDCSFREAIEDADANAEADTITFAPGLTGTITLTSPLEVDSVEGIDVQGPGVDVVSISGDTDSSGDPSSGDVQILYVNDGASLSISDLTLTQGYIDCACPGKYGGAITMLAESTVSIADAALTDNVGTAGGAIANLQGTLDVERTELSGNYSGLFGGAIFAGGPKYTPTPTPGDGEPMTTTITDSQISDNAALGGGGVWVQGAKYAPGDDPIPELGQVSITGTTISGNEASLGGGLVTKYADTSVADSTFTGNHSTYGTALSALSGETTVTGATISGNGDVAYSGGAVTVGKYARFELQKSTITGNQGDSGAGMAIALGQPSGSPYDKYATPPAASVSVTRSTIADNEAYDDGGGVFVRRLPAGDSVELVDSTISGNSAADPASTGGGVELNGYIGGDASIVNSTISGNEAAYGGGISVGLPYETPPSSPYGYYGAPTIENSTIAANNATVAGGGIYLGGYNTDPATSGAPSASADLPLSSAIVADNTANGSANDLAAATVDEPGSFQVGSSLVETPGAAPVDQTPAGSSILGTDPQLGALADNGGPTKTQLPAAGSPVVDKGVANGLTTDQRGLARVSGAGTDIGSVELQVAPTPPDTQGPVITITKKPKKKLGTRKAKRNVRVGFKSNEPGSTFECKVNGAAFKPCERPFKMKLKAKPGKGAKYKIRIRGTDPAGNTGDAVGVKTKVVRKG